MKVHDILSYTEVDIHNLEIKESNLEYLDIIARCKSKDRKEWEQAEEDFYVFFERVDIFDSIECFYLFNTANCNLLSI